MTLNAFLNDGLSILNNLSKNWIDAHQEDHWAN
jgi:hypothetical protein